MRSWEYHATNITQMGTMSTWKMIGTSLVGTSKLVLHLCNASAGLSTWRGFDDPKKRIYVYKIVADIDRRTLPIDSSKNVYANGPFLRPRRRRRQFLPLPGTFEAIGADTVEDWALLTTENEERADVARVVAAARLTDAGAAVVVLPLPLPAPGAALPPAAPP